MSNAPDLLSHSSDSFFHIGYSAPKGSFNLQRLQLSCSVVPHIPQQHLPKPSSPLLRLSGTIIHAYCLSLALSHNETDKPADSFLVSLVFRCFLSIYFTFCTHFSYSTNQMEPLECSCAEYVIPVPSGPVLSRVIRRDWSSDQKKTEKSMEKPKYCNGCTAAAPVSRRNRTGR